jgi:hypothetical protein
VKGLCQGLASEPLERGPGDALAEAAVRQAQGYGLHRGDGDKEGNGVRQRDASRFLGDEGTVALAQSRDPACWIGLRRGTRNRFSKNSHQDNFKRKADVTGSSNGGGGGTGLSGGGGGQDYDGAAWDRHWAWEGGEETMASVTWRAWARGQPDNATSEVEGERCAAMGPSLYSVERQHLGLWQDER